MSVVAGALACRAGAPQAPPSEPAPQVESPESTPLIPAEPANKGAGEQLEARIPLVGGEVLELASLRGQPVLLELSASWEPGWSDAHALYGELQREHPGLEVIIVAMDPDSAALLELPPGPTAAWDPAGALAAQLSVATFPTMFVLDGEGRIAAVLNGWGEEVAARLRASVAEVTGGSATSEAATPS